MAGELDVGTPRVAGMVVAPLRIPPAGSVPSATATLPVTPAAGFPGASRALTCTAGAIARPSTTLLGGTVNASWLAVPARILKPALVVPVSPAPVTASVYPVPALSTLRSANVATPATAARVVVPASLPPAGFVPIATVTLPVAAPAPRSRAWPTPPPRGCGPCGPSQRARPPRRQGCSPSPPCRY